MTSLLKFHSTEIRNGYFVIKTVLPLLFQPKNGLMAKRLNEKLRPTFIWKKGQRPPKENEMGERRKHFRDYLNKNNRLLLVFGLSAAFRPFSGMVVEHSFFGPFGTFFHYQRWVQFVLWSRQSLWNYVFQQKVVNMRSAIKEERYCPWCLVKCKLELSLLLTL